MGFTCCHLSLSVIQRRYILNITAFTTLIVGMYFICKLTPLTYDFHSKNEIDLEHKEENNPDHQKKANNELMKLVMYFLCAFTVYVTSFLIHINYKLEGLSLVAPNSQIPRPCFMLNKVFTVCILSSTCLTIWKQSPAFMITGVMTSGYYTLIVFLIKVLFKDVFKDNNVPDANITNNVELETVVIDTGSHGPTEPTDPDPVLNSCIFEVDRLERFRRDLQQTFKPDVSTCSCISESLTSDSDEHSHLYPIYEEVASIANSITAVSINNSQEEAAVDNSKENTYANV